MNALHKVRILTSKGEVKKKHIDLNGLDVSMDGLQYAINSYKSGNVFIECI